MRRTRITFKGSYHHIMNRGIRVINIFSDDKLKNKFIGFIEEKLKKLKVKILAYYLIDNHYDFIL